MTNSLSMEDKKILSAFTVSTKPCADHLNSAINLWKENRSTLGLFPQGAFEEYAQHEWLIYLLQNGNVIGYLLYRSARQRIAISHLCISDQARGKGGAKLLFETLKEKVDDGYCKGIEVRCRSDYPISRMWPKLGFECAHHIPGRAKEGSELTVWFYKFDVNDLFNNILPEAETNQALAVLDANVVFKIGMPNNIDSEESLALVSDAISPYVKYYVTPEIFAEIERKQDSDEKDNSTRTANRYHRIDVKRSSFENYCELLRPLWGDIKADRDRSDLNHIAYSAAAGFQYFITQDNGILEKAPKITEICSLVAMRPVDFITQLDQVENAEKYIPRSLSQTLYRLHSPSSADIPLISSNYCLPNEQEKKKTLEAKIRRAIANPEKYRTIFISNSKNEPVVFICFKKENHTISIEIMRHSGDIISRTIVQNLIWNDILNKHDEELLIIDFCDEHSLNSYEHLLQLNGFINHKNGWSKVSARIVESKEKSIAKIQSFLNKEIGSQEDKLHCIERVLHSSENAPPILEEAFWPLKIDTQDIGSHLVPIKPTWALHLFDRALAEQELWGADPLKHFNVENVYYRSSRPVKMSPGDRIIWYVSSEGNKKISEIRACSRLISSETDTARNLFKKYQRLGIYSWHDLMNLTNGDPEGHIMALRFHQTEYFINHIDLNTFPQYGINGAPLSPREVSGKQFIQVYKYGMNHD